MKNEDEKETKLNAEINLSLVSFVPMKSRKKKIIAELIFSSRYEIVVRIFVDRFSFISDFRFVLRRIQYFALFLFLKNE